MNPTFPRSQAPDWERTAAEAPPQTPLSDSTAQLAHKPDSATEEKKPSNSCRRKHQLPQTT